MQDVGNILKRRSRLAIGLTALLVLVSQVLIQYTLYGQEENGALIIQASRQETYCQAIVNKAQDLVQAENVPTHQAALDDLQVLVEQWDDANRHLGSLANPLNHVVRDTRVAGMYRVLDRHHNTIMQAADTLLSLAYAPASANRAVAETALNQIRKAAPPYGAQMRMIVDHYEEQSRAEFKTLQMLEIMLAVLTLLALATALRFVFQPTIREIRGIVERLNAEKENYLAERDGMQAVSQQALRQQAATGALFAGIAREKNTPVQNLGDHTRLLKDVAEEVLEARMAMQKAMVLFRESGRDPALVSEAAHLIEATELAHLADEIPDSLNQTLDGINRVSELVEAMKALAHPAADEKGRRDPQGI